MSVTSFGRIVRVPSSVCPLGVPSRPSGRQVGLYVRRRADEVVLNERREAV